MTLIVYHRGGGKSLGLPPNCLRTFRWALERNAPAIEYDTCVCLDADQPLMAVVEPALLTDRDLDIDRLTWREVRSINAGDARHGLVATLAEVLRTLAGRTHQQIHLKGANPLTVPTLLQEVGEGADCLVTSFSLAVLTQVKAGRPGLRIGWLIKPDGSSGSEGSRDLTARMAGARPPPYAAHEVDEILERAKAAGVDCVIPCASRLAGADVVERIRRAGFEVGCWGVGCNLGLAARLIAFGVDRFTIDNPEQLPPQP